MKNFTFLKSAWAFFAAIALAMPAQADVASVADLYGKYKFAANVEVTEAGQSLTEHFKSECDVVITKCSANIYDGEIQGLAGATGAQKINGIDVENKVIKITNPNGSGLWGGGLYMSDANGMYPFGMDSTYNDIVYAYDADTRTITMPEFTLVTCDHANSKATIVAKFTNATLTLVEAENIEVADLSGDWHFTAVTGGYNTMENSTLPTEWDMTLTATDDSKKAYSLSLTLGDFAPLALSATFDGTQLTIPFDETSYFDVENKIGIVNMYGVARPGTITFNMASESVLTLTSGMTIAQDSISPEVKGGYLQWYMAGSAKKQGGEVATETWDGTYTVKVGSLTVGLADFTYPEEFEMEVVYYEASDVYLVTKFMGNDVSALNYGGILLTPSAEDPNKAEIKTGGYLKSIVAGESYLCLKDVNLSNASSIVLTRLEDGTYTLSDFSVSHMTYNADWSQNHAFAAYCQQVTAEKVVEEEFSWANTFVVKAGNIAVYNDAYSYPSEFEVEVVYYEESGVYLVTKFMGNDVSALNYGGILLTPSTEDPNKAEIKTGSYLQSIVPGESYFCLMDMNASNASNLTLTRGEDGVIAISDFCVTYMTYNADWSQNHAAAALYTGVTATVGTTSVEEVLSASSKVYVADGVIYVGEAQYVEVYDLSGRVAFAGTASQVGGLNNGLYIVRVGNKATKVAVK